MRNIAQLFRQDLKRVTRNAIATVVLIGVVLIPSFFAWFNVLASWDPFGNVKNLKVAVANGDKGFKSEIFPMTINIGEQVISTLRANSDLNWVFTTPEEAVEGTSSEEYYAALVLPPDFSKEMMTFLSPGAKSTQIEYYTNEKKNALSPKITEEAASEVSTKINETFTKTLNEVGISLISSLAHYLEDPQTQTALANLEVGVNDLAAQLNSGANTAYMFSSLVASSVPLAEGASALASSSVEALHDTTGVIDAGASAASSLQAVLESATASLSNALSASATSFGTLSKEVDKLYTDVSASAKTAAKGIRDLENATVQPRIQHYEDLLAQLENLEEDAENLGLEDELQLVINRVEAVIDSLNELKSRLLKSADRIDAGVADGNTARAEVQAIINEAIAAIDGARNAYDNSMRPKLDQLSGELAAINNGFHAIGDDLFAVSERLAAGSGSLVGLLEHTQSLTDDVAELLQQAADRFDKVAAVLALGQDTAEFDQVSEIIGSNPEVLATALTEPVSLRTIPVFKVDNFGSQMAPLYSVLGLWVGALLLSVLIRTEVMPGSIDFKTRPTNTQEYFGRYGIFALLGFLQSSVMFLGLIGFVGMRPVHPFLFLLTGWLMSLVFTLITYTLVISLGEAGKAVAVFLLVVQISASGGAYPLAVLPNWFQHVSAFLPATYGMDSIRSAIAGIYEGDYWISMGWLAFFIVPMLLLGLLLRIPFIKFNNDLNKALDSTKLMSI